MENLPHAISTFFELSIALFALSLRTLNSINHITDTALHETEKVIKSENLDDFYVWNRRSILGGFSWLGLFLSVSGILMFGLGEFAYWGGKSCLWTAFLFFIWSAFMATLSDSQKMRNFSKVEKLAAKPVERFQTGE